MDTIIRKATENDLNDLYDLIKEFADFTGKSEFMKLTKSELEEEFSSYICFLAETTQKEITGYAFLFHTFHTWSGKAIFLEELYVRNNFRRLGIGTRLINAAIDYGKEHGCNKVRWQVYDWNTDAIASYEKLGATVGDNRLNCELDI